MSRSSTMLTSAYCAIVLVVMSLFSLFVSALQLSITATLLMLPIAALLSFAAARKYRGLPATMAGVGKSGKSSVDSTKSRSNRPASQPRFQLVAMPVNHYGEKLRWIMDLVQAPYEESTVGGITSVTFRGRSVPWLVDRQSCSIIGNSDECVAFISSVFVPTIEDETRRAKCENFLKRTSATIPWESRLSLLGHAVQGWCYNYILRDGEDASVSLRAWGAMETKHVPWTHRLAINLGGNYMKKMLKSAFQVHKPEATENRHKLIMDAFAAADEALSKHAFLTGDSLTYVDIGFASLVAPILVRSVLFATPKSFYANGRFESFHGSNAGADKLVEPKECAAMELMLKQRPCGKFVIKLFTEMRGSSL